MLAVEHLRKVVEWARDRGTVVVCDECYLEFGWDGDAGVGAASRCLWRHRTRGCWRCTRCRSGRTSRATAPASSPATALVAELLEVRKHAGMIVPAPVQAAMVAALDDDAHVEVQRARYLARRAMLAGPRWWPPASRSTTRRAASTCGRPATRTAGPRVEWLADSRILVAPGDFYGAGRPPAMCASR